MTEAIEKGAKQASVDAVVKAGDIPPAFRVKTFADALEKRGVFPRRYAASDLLHLYFAAKWVHAHLCALDLGHQVRAQHIELQQLADAYAEASEGTRRFLQERLPEQDDSPWGYWQTADEAGRQAVIEELVGLHRTAASGAVKNAAQAALDVLDGSVQA